MHFLFGVVEFLEIVEEVRQRVSVAVHHQADQDGPLVARVVVHRSCRAIRDADQRDQSQRRRLHVDSKLTTGRLMAEEYVRVATLASRDLTTSSSP